MSGPQIHPASRLVRRLPSPIGPLGVVLEQGVLVRIHLPGLGRPDPLPPTTPTATEGDTDLAALARGLTGWFAGEDRALHVLPHRLEGTPFQRRIWRAAQAIPRGRALTYAEVAQAAGAGRGAARAVGGALRANPLPLLVPCHRVVGAGGRLVGFGGSRTDGLKVKNRLLRLEGFPCVN